jgi:hypothetical protein
MTLEYGTDENGYRNGSCRLTECPVCGYSLRDRRGSKLRYHLLNDHGPEDFGLSPLAD